MRSACLVFITAMATACPSARAQQSNYTIEQATLFPGPAKYWFSQARGTTLADGTLLITTQEIERAGSHGYHDVFQVTSSDGGASWSSPKLIEPLRRGLIAADSADQRAIGDLCPRLHVKTGRVLATGKTFTFRDGTKEDRGAEQVSYAVYDPKADAWTAMKIVELPQSDHEGRPFLQPNAGCNDRVDLPSGEILLPIRYCKDPRKRCYTTMVARCRFDGTTLRYIEHGSELSRTENRGLYEPSLHALGGKYYLTMRADDTAFVSVSTDGLIYSAPKEWAYDDGQALGSYNTQQHWVSNGDKLYLVYTRRGAGNDHIFRHRAPLFIAEVDTARICILRETEQVLIPANHADIGNFDVIPAGPKETWVVAAESPNGPRLKDAHNNVIAARIRWK